MRTRDDFPTRSALIQDVTLEHRSRYSTNVVPLRQKTTRRLSDAPVHCNHHDDSFIDDDRDHQ
jgi:hypothetical protein